MRQNCRSIFIIFHYIFITCPLHIIHYTFITYSLQIHYLSIAFKFYPRIFPETGLWWPRWILPPRSQIHITFFENVKTTATNSTNFNWFLVQISLFFRFNILEKIVQHTWKNSFSKNKLKCSSIIRFGQFWVDLSKNIFFDFEKFSMSQPSWKNIFSKKIKKI